MSRILLKDLEPAEGKDELEDQQAWKVVQDVALLNLAIGGDGGGDPVIYQKWSRGIWFLVSKTIFSLNPFHFSSIKHCQRHNGPRN